MVMIGFSFVRLRTLLNGAIIVLTLLVMGNESVSGQSQTLISTGTGGSPRVRTEQKIGDGSISIDYGRPSLRGRPDELMMPVGRPWRTGADAATLLRTNRSLRFGEFKLSPGVYTLATEPGSWTLLVGKLERDGQWGSPYRPDLELKRLKMKAAPGPHVEQLTIIIRAVGQRAGSITIEWGQVRASIDFTVDNR
jgi:hypothetical protein